MYFLPCLWVSLVLCATCSVVYGMDGKTSKCDPKMIAYSSVLPSDLLDKIFKQGPYSYVLMSPENMKVNGNTASCVGVSLQDTKTALVSKKIPGVSTPHVEKFVVENKGNYLLYTSTDELQISYKLYIIFQNIKDGVLITYTCCDGCTATSPNVGMAVADKMSNNYNTKVALTEAKSKAIEMNIDSHMKTLDKC